MDGQMMQKLPYKVFEFSTISSDVLLSTPDYVYYVGCDIDFVVNVKTKPSIYH